MPHLVLAGTLVVNRATRGAKTWEKPHRDPSLDVVQSKPHSKVYPIGVTTQRKTNKYPVARPRYDVLG